MTLRSGIALATLRKELMMEAGLSTQSGQAAFSMDRLNYMLNRTERLMALEEEWQSQHFEEYLPVAADERYPDLPANISFTMIDTIHVSYGDDWLPIKQGIGARERTIYKPTQRAMPITRYEYSAERPTQIEVWPVGGSEQTLYVQGSKTVGAMEKETDTCTLDGDVIVWRCAAQILGRDNQADADLLLGYAAKKTEQLAKRMGSMKRQPVNLAGKKTKTLRPGIDYIAPGST